MLLHVLDEIAEAFLPLLRPRIPGPTWQFGKTALPIRIQLAVAVQLTLPRHPPPKPIPGQGNQARRNERVTFALDIAQELAEAFLHCSAH